MLLLELVQANDPVAELRTNAWIRLQDMLQEDLLVSHKRFRAEGEGRQWEGGGRGKKILKERKAMPVY